ncbi:MerR-like DNA binding protein [Diaminobutyricimonas aerilata]|uniref:MerR-like DNA binding protein n=1 Tax=Diaminobutyricimonas aerilata TaxID=1162967 RepID=A0A2M9CGU8_9MICO|nr:MerR family transcriptional regulator [Diaminobutyricimonas aerilata]PJJ71109.1 MerR-like DNA binding protein [Diaminobutyricimonas aerilata]
MRVSELVERSGVPLASIKYYLREGLLMPGESTGATQARYDERHLKRLRLIKALTDVVGLSVQKAREVIAVIDEPVADPFDNLGRAIAALPPYTDATGDAPRARAVLERLGQVCDPSYAGVAQLERALEAAEAAGMPMSDERLAVYGEHVRAIAEFDISGVPDDPAAAVEYSVIGTTLYEPVLLAMRRLAHHDAAYRRLRGAEPGSAEPSAG